MNATCAAALPRLTTETPGGAAAVDWLTIWFTAADEDPAVVASPLYDAAIECGAVSVYVCTQVA